MASSNTDDAMLIQAILKDGRDYDQALGRFYRQHLTGALLFLKKNSWLADDHDMAISIYHDAVMGVVKGVKDGKYEARANLKNYLYSILSNKQTEAYRGYQAGKRQFLRQALNGNTLPDCLKNPLKGPEDQMVTEEECLMVDQVLNTFEEKCKKILLLSESGYSHAELAQELQMTVGSVKVRKSQCLKELRKQMKRLLS